MPTIRERLANALLGDERQRLIEATNTLYNAYKEGPFLMTPDTLLNQLRETDSAILNDLVMQLQYEQMGSLGYNPAQTEAERVRAVDESRRQYKYDVVVQWIVHLWTDFGFGENIVITPVDEDAKETWSEFWTADRNANVLSDDELSFLSEDLLVDGEKFLTFYISDADGKATLRDIDTKEITGIITAPGDDRTVLFYKRNYTEGSQAKEAYYPDWLAFITGELDKDYTAEVLPKNAIRADTMNEGTIVMMLHVAHNRKGDLRGWPLMTAGIPWSREHKRFRENRATLAAAVASLVRKTKIKGGSRAIEQVRAKLTSALTATNTYETNPPPAAGSTLLENEGADTTTFPLTTGAGDAQIDGDSLLMMAGLGGGVFPHWLGAGEAFRLATADAMEVPLLREFTRYQQFWSSQFRKMVRIVLWADEQYGDHLEYKTYDAVVSTDKLIQNDFGKASSAVAGLAGQALMPFIEGGVVTGDTGKLILRELWRYVLSTMGVKNINDIVNDKTFAVTPVAPAEVDKLFLPALSDNGHRLSPQEKINMALASIKELRGKIGSIQIPEGETKVTVNYLEREKITNMTETQVIQRNQDTGEILGAEATQLFTYKDKDGVHERRVIEHRKVKRHPVTKRITGIEAVREYEGSK